MFGSLRTLLDTTTCCATTGCLVPRPSSAGGAAGPGPPAPRPLPRARGAIDGSAYGGNSPAVLLTTSTRDTRHSTTTASCCVHPAHARVGRWCGLGAAWRPRRRRGAAGTGTAGLLLGERGGGAAAARRTTSSARTCGRSRMGSWRRRWGCVLRGVATMHHYTPLSFYSDRRFAQLQLGVAEALPLSCCEVGSFL
jgi:hypothetical protein